MTSGFRSTTPCSIMNTCWKEDSLPPEFCLTSSSRATQRRKLYETSYTRNEHSKSASKSEMKKVTDRRRTIKRRSRRRKKRRRWRRSRRRKHRRKYKRGRRRRCSHVRCMHVFGRGTSGLESRAWMRFIDGHGVPDGRSLHAARFSTATGRLVQTRH